MLLNYFKIAWRNLLRNKTFSLIKIIGLSIGLMVCMLIFLYTKDELSYDQFQINKAQLYRIVQTFQRGKEPQQSIGITNSIVGESIAKEIPEVQQYVRIIGEAVTVKKDNDVFTENPLFVDDNFLSVFTFPLMKGDIKTALKDLHSAVLSKNLAKKYFGTTDVIGKTIQLKLNDEFEPFIVTAVSENSPQNSTLKTDMLLPLKYFENYNDNRGWFGGSMITFLFLSPQANIKTVEGKMQALLDMNIKDKLAKMQLQQGVTVAIKLSLQPLTDIHLGKLTAPDREMADVSNPAYSYILTCIAIFTLIIACINFINLAIAQSLKRSKEIGIRKVVGSTRVQLIKQFLTESFLVSLIAFSIAIFLTLIVLPFFNELANKKLSLSYLSDGYLYAGYFLLLLVTSFLVGFYPSLVLSSFQPIKVLYNRQKLMGNNYLTKGLIVFQFALAFFLIIGTIAVNSQLNFLLNADQGYDSKNLVRIDIPISKSSDQLPAIFKSELSNQSNIVNVAAKNRGRSISGVKADGKSITIENNRIDENYLPTFKIPFIAGRNFSQDYPGDNMNSVIVNESFLKEAGWNTHNAIGKRITMDTRDHRSATVIGVIKDYHFTSL
ncbi:MAG TPA: ABC transporter permease, partial [Puia sp.]|nr:ABC transporter permease [Puia sp.]